MHSSAVAVADMYSSDWSKSCGPTGANTLGVEYVTDDGVCMESWGTLTVVSR